jgi:hypothetical protein
MLDQARADLATARARDAAHNAALERLRQAVGAAERRLGDVDAATAAARDAGDAATRRVERHAATSPQRNSDAPRRLA